MQATIFPVALYGNESLTLKKQNRKYINDFELRCGRRLMVVHDLH